MTVVIIVVIVHKDRGTRDGERIAFKLSTFTIFSEKEKEERGRRRDLKALEVLLGHCTGTGIDSKSHVGDLTVNLLHELNDEVNQFVLVHALGVSIGHQETDVVSLFFAS